MSSYSTVNTAVQVIIFVDDSGNFLNDFHLIRDVYFIFSMISTLEEIYLQFSHDSGKKKIHRPLALIP